jgi:hypothetical protein
MKGRQPQVEASCGVAYGACSCLEHWGGPVNR